MQANIKYIYSAMGEIEAAIVPINLWHQLVPKQHPEVTKRPPFDPSPFKGMLRRYNLNIEQELKNMRDEWTNDF